MLNTPAFMTEHSSAQEISLRAEDHAHGYIHYLCNNTAHIVAVRCVGGLRTAKPSSTSKSNSAPELCKPWLTCSLGLT